MTPPDLELVARRGACDLADAEASDVVAWASATFGTRFCATSSMTDAVLVDLVSRVAPGTDVVFLDTGYHFAETLGTRDAVASAYPVNLITITPVRTVEEQDARHGARLHDRDPDLCCALRKVEPLERAMRGYDAWATGLRRSESPTRARTGVVEWDAARGKVKVNPLAAWTDEDVAAYVAEHDVMVNPLLLDGYASVGCGPCTRRVGPGEQPRDGRWAGIAKVECGIHG